MNIKHIIRCYQLGRHILKHLVDFPEFNFNDGIIRKQIQHSNEYEGTIHTVSYIDKNKWTEISLIKLD